MVSSKTKSPFLTLFYISICIAVFLMLYLFILNQRNQQNMTDAEVQVLKKKIKLYTRILFGVLVSIVIFYFLSRKNKGVEIINNGSKSTATYVATNLSSNDPQQKSHVISHPVSKSTANITSDVPQNNPQQKSHFISDLDLANKKRATKYANNMSEYRQTVMKNLRAYAPNDFDTMIDDLETHLEQQNPDLVYNKKALLAYYETIQTMRDLKSHKEDVLQIEGNLQKLLQTRAIESQKTAKEQDRNHAEKIQKLQEELKELKSWDQKYQEGHLAIQEEFNKKDERLREREIRLEDLQRSLQQMGVLTMPPRQSLVTRASNQIGSLTNSFLSTISGRPQKTTLYESVNPNIIDLTKDNFKEPTPPKSKRIVIDLTGVDDQSTPAAPVQTTQPRTPAAVSTGANTRSAAPAPAQTTPAPAAVSPGANTRSAAPAAVSTGANTRSAAAPAAPAQTTQPRTTPAAPVPAQTNNQATGKVRGYRPGDKVNKIDLFNNEIYKLKVGPRETTSNKSKEKAVEMKGLSDNLSFERKNDVTSITANSINNTAELQVNGNKCFQDEIYLIKGNENYDDDADGTKVLARPNRWYMGCKLQSTISDRSQLPITILKKKVSSQTGTTTRGK